jgi:hypothetical protein
VPEVKRYKIILADPPWAVTPLPAGCIEWPAGKTTGGYGMFRVNRRAIYAHRAALEFKLGRPIGEGLYACHTCDNRGCVNPAHLFEGDAAENAADMVAKERQARGAHHSQAVLDEPKVREIHALVAAGAEHQAVADRFGVSNQCVSKIATGRHWRHLNLSPIHRHPRRSK